MEFFRIKRDIPFMRYALIFNVISIVTFLIAVGALAFRGLASGRRFHRRHGDGGQVSAGRRTSDTIREAMSRLGFTDAAVQNFGTASDVLIRLPVKQGVTSAKLSEQVMGS